MYIISIPGKVWGNETLVVLKDVVYDPRVIIDIYRQICSVDVTFSKSMLSSSFLSSLDFDGNVAHTTSKDLFYAFRTWTNLQLYSVYMQVLNAYMLYSVYIVETYTNMTIVCMDKLKGWRGFLRIEVVEDTNSKVDDSSAPDARIEQVVEEMTESPPMEEDVTIEEALKHINDKTINEVLDELRHEKPEDIIKKINNWKPFEDILKEILNAKPRTVDESAAVEKVPDEDGFHKIEEIIKQFNNSKPKTTEDHKAARIVADECMQRLTGAGSIERHSAVDLIELGEDSNADGYVVFNRKRDQYICACIVDMEQMYIAKKEVPDSMPEKYNILVRFMDSDGKVGISCFDDTHLDAINNLQDIGIDNIIIKDVVIFPWKHNFEKLAPVVVQDSSLSGYIQQVYALRKLIVPRSVEGSVIKQVMTTIYNKYEFSYGAKVNIKDIYMQYTKMIGLSKPIQFDVFCSVIAYLGYMIKGGEVLNMKELSAPLDIKCASFKEKESVSEWCRTMNGNLQIRAEPPVPVNTQVSPWSLSSRLYTPKDLGIL